MLIIFFAVVLHYSVTIQYSAYFHIYFNISKKYEKKLHDPKSHKHLKKTGVLKEWLMEIKKNPFKKGEEELEEDQ